MGFSRRWTQLRKLGVAEWAIVIEDVKTILNHVQHVADIPLANGNGESGTHPELTTGTIFFNGVGKDMHDCFEISRVPDVDSWDFCKTDRKPYDIAVQAVLCYLDTCLDTPAFYIQSDGHGKDFLEGLDLTRKALPHKANILDIPMGVLKNDRWTGPWISRESNQYQINFCIDGKGYVYRERSNDWYCFPTHLALAEFLNKHKTAKFRNGGQVNFGHMSLSYDNTEPNIWRATGSFDEARHERIGRAQNKVLATLFPVPPENAIEPPAYVRPGEMPRPEEIGEFCYYLEDLLAKVQENVA